MKESNQKQTYEIWNIKLLIIIIIQLTYNVYKHFTLMGEKSKAQGILFHYLCNNHLQKSDVETKFRKTIIIFKKKKSDTQTQIENTKSETKFKNRKVIYKSISFQEHKSYLKVIYMSPNDYEINIKSKGDGVVKNRD